MKAIFSFKLLLLSGCFALCSPAQADPTRPPKTSLGNLDTAPGNQEYPVKLQLILKNADGYKAMLNGQMLKAGDMLAAYKVLSITADKVVLVSENGQMQLTINNNSIKTYEPE